MILVGNWKMNGSINLVNTWLKYISSSEISTNNTYILCPPNAFLSHLYVSLFSSLYSSGENNIYLGAQDCSIYSSCGSYTGDISADILSDVGSKYVILGHSERRSMYHEDDIIVSQKFSNVISCNMIPIVCFGEMEKSSLKERYNFFSRVFSNIEKMQEKSSTNDKKIIFAYEPVWAIGKSSAAPVEYIEEFISFIKHNHANIIILYGGSVNKDNIDFLSKCRCIDGFLIGRYSLHPECFFKMV